MALQGNIAMFSSGDHNYFICRNTVLAVCDELYIETGKKNIPIMPNTDTKLNQKKDQPNTRHLRFVSFILRHQFTFTRQLLQSHFPGYPHTKQR
jgi:hypothetical protein